MQKLFSYVAIPAENFERAFAFYAMFTNGHVHHNPGVPFPMAYFTDTEGRDIGHIFQHPDFRPSGDGVLIYTEVDDIDKTLADIEQAGGKTIMPKALIAPGKGSWALFLDTEGNKLALHSMQG